MLDNISIFHSVDLKLRDTEELEEILREKDSNILIKIDSDGFALFKIKKGHEVDIRDFEKYLSIITWFIQEGYLTVILTSEFEAYIYFIGPEEIILHKTGVNPFEQLDVYELIGED